MRKYPTVFRALLASVVFTGCDCGSDAPKVCTLGTSDGCDANQVCEATVGGGDPVCAAPVEIRGRVFDGDTDAAIEGATVVGVDINGSARTSTAVTDASGNYTLQVPMTRNADGTVAAGEQVTLRVAAAGYQPFPKTPRPALPIDTAAAVDMSGTLVVDTANTDVSLFATNVDPSTVSRIEGTVSADPSAGLLVVAVQNGVAVATALTDADGNYVLFDVPRGVATTIEAWAAGTEVAPLSLTPSTATVTGADLTGSSTGLVTVTGNVQIVNAPGGLTTSIILVPEATFDDVALRGEAPVGYRVGNVSGNFSIAGIAPGTYVVLAAFENDQLVRDPDTSIGGTDLVVITIPDGVSTYAIPQSFKVTEALAVVSPGANGLDVLASNPTTLTWQDDSSEDGYEVFLYDQFGALVHENLVVPRVTGNANVTYTIPNTVTFVSGRIYQFRAYSYTLSGATHVRLSATEDLKGVFQVP